MTTVTKSLIVATFVLCFGFIGVTGQVLLNPVNKVGPGVKSDERHIYLESQQELEVVEVTEGCLIFLNEVRFSVTLPVGTTVEILLPAGSTWSIPSGRYKLDNPTKTPIEYVLKMGSPCKQ